MKRLLIILLSVLFTQCSRNDGLTEIERLNNKYKNEIDVHYGIGTSADPIARHIIAFENAIFQYALHHNSITNNINVDYSNTEVPSSEYEETECNFDIEVLDIYIEEDTEYIALRFIEGDKYCCHFCLVTKYFLDSKDGIRLNSNDSIYLTINQNNVFSDNQGELFYHSMAFTKEIGDEQTESIWKGIHYECYQNEQYKYNTDSLESKVPSHFVEIK